MNANYELIIVGAIAALAGKIIWDWLSKTRTVTNDHSHTEENYKMLGQVETELRKLNHAMANLRQTVDVLAHSAQELRDDIKELRSRL